MANKIKYPFCRMNVGDYHKIPFESKVDVCRAQQVAVVTARTKSFTFTTKVTEFTLEVWRNA